MHLVWPEWLDDTQINGLPSSVSLPFLRILVTFSYRSSTSSLKKVKSWRNTSGYVTASVRKRRRASELLFYHAEEKKDYSRVGMTAGLARTALHCTALHWLYHASTYAIRGISKVVDYR